MFKYLRTETGDYHPTEILEVFSSVSVTDFDGVPIGSFFTIEEGMVQQFCDIAHPLYLALNAETKNKITIIKCFPVTSNMIFEGSLAPSENEEMIFEGSLCTLEFDQNGKGVYLSLTFSSEMALFEVIDTSNIKNRKITVRKI